MMNSKHCSSSILVFLVQINCPQSNFTYLLSSFLGWIYLQQQQHYPLNCTFWYSHFLISISYPSSSLTPVWPCQQLFNLSQPANPSPHGNHILANIPDFLASLFYYCVRWQKYQTCLTQTADLLPVYNQTTKHFWRKSNNHYWRVCFKSVATNLN